MPELLYPYLVGFLSLIVVVLAAFWAFVVNYWRAIDYRRKEERLPQAARWADLRERVVDLQEQWDQLRGEVQQAKLTIDEAEREREWLAQNRHEIEQMKQEREQVERVRADLVQAQEEYASIRQKLEEAELAKAKAEFSCLSLKEQIPVLEQRLADQQKSLESEQNRLDTMRREIGEADKQLTIARRQLGELTEGVAHAQQHLEALKREIQDLTHRRDEIKREKDTLQAQTDTLKVTAAQLKEQAAQHDQRVKDLSNRISELRGEERKRDKALASPEEALAELFNPVIALTEYPAASRENSEGVALQRVQSYLRALGLKFPNRVVNAFHTSLKVARDTPLLVLAGISGTGKSLLPRRYAEAMGIHFLGIPVQPRWDGPQDLLGFFNYLESRYKATDLIRALIQFDPCDRDWLPGDYKDLAPDRMLMVLLDEMNLARIEYYFSEFLSRLETRRDLFDVDNDADRVKAEITLDIGRFAEEANCRVFVDTNVLFVGTMNEDESTLTLSDKVIDRANVMRFGRPLSLALAERNGEQSAERLRAQGFLSKNVWVKWVAEGARRVLPEQVEHWIRDLNDSLGIIGRPFGYRTRNAMHAYVQHYPERSDDGMRLAVADQIEQRILPKLRGVDPADDAGQRAIEGVKRVVQDLHDRQLLDAIDRGISSQGGHLFTWGGVERTDDTE